jgi:hypothetical protein
MSKDIGKVGPKSPEAIGAFLIAPERGTMPRTPSRHCFNYSAGHDPHYIQARKAGEVEWVKAKVEYLGSNIFQLHLEDGQVLIRFNHEPARLNDYLDWFGESAVWFQNRFYLLGIETGTGRAMFSLSTEPIGACELKKA